MRIVDGNLLMYVLSKYKSGTWDLWKNIIDVISGGAAVRKTLLASRLSSSAMVDFDFDHTLSWRACPAVLAGLLPEGGGSTRAFLRGARTSSLLVELFRRAEERGIKILDSVSAEWLPNCLVLEGEKSDLKALADLCNIGWQEDPAGAIASCLPNIGDLSPFEGTRDYLPVGHLAEELLAETDELAFREVNHSRPSDGSLYRVRRNGRWEFWFVERGRLSQTSWAVGSHKLLASRGLDLVEYRADERTLHVPFYAPLPALHARAATLGYGGYPVDSDVKGNISRIIYKDVSEKVAQKIKNSLRVADA